MAAAIVMNSQSLADEAPDIVAQFKHNLSLASSSKTDKQRKDALSYLTNQLSKDDPVNPVGTNNILAKLSPLVSDSSTPVRKQLQVLLDHLPGEEVRHHADRMLLHVRAGMTHLSNDVSNDALGVMDWLLGFAADEIVSCAGGWVKTLETFCAMMGWTPKSSSSGWTSGSKVTLRAKDSTTHARQISVLAKMVQAGLEPRPSAADDSKPDSAGGRWDYLCRVPSDPKAFDYLNLNGSTSSNDQSQRYASREERQQVFKARFSSSISKGASDALQAGGATGRAAAALQKALDAGLEDYEESSTAIDARALLDLW